MDVLDKNNPTPLYYQLKEIIREGIEKGVWKTGDTIPTEMELIEQYGISRSTVRQAILALVNDGYLRREKSKGTIVNRPAERMRFVGGLMSFSREMDLKGIPHFSRILEQKVIPADETITAKLELSMGELVYYLKRVRYVKDRPYLVDQHYIPYYLCPGIEKKYTENTSLYSLLQAEYNFNLHHGQIDFEPISPPSKEIVDLLKIYSTTNLTLAERIVYSDLDVPLDYFRAIIHGKFTVDVITSRGLSGR